MNNSPQKDKDKNTGFLDESREKWCGIFTLIGILILILSSYGWLKAPEPFLQFFLSIGVTFIIGASATAVMNSWKTNHNSQNNIGEGRGREDRRDDRDRYDRPYSQRARGDEYE